jgi:hypothetical protein
MLLQVNSQYRMIYYTNHNSMASTLYVHIDEDSGYPDLRVPHYTNGSKGAIQYCVCVD